MFINDSFKSLIQYICFLVHDTQKLDSSKTNGLSVRSAIGVLLAIYNNGTLRCIALSCRQVHGSATLCRETRSSQHYRFARFAHLLSSKQKHTGFPTIMSTRICDVLLLKYYCFS